MPDTPDHKHIKICGLSEPDTLRAALQAGADMVGFVFYPPSPRAVTPEAAARLAAITRAESAARVVALTVDADDALLDEITLSVRPDVHQLHGRESAGRAADVAARFGSVMKAIPVRSNEAVGEADAYANLGAAILFDAPPPPTSDLPGGNGTGFDWTALAEARTPYLLSGGLDVSNVAMAMSQPGSSGVDVSSGVERERGVKDVDLIRAFVAAARGLGRT